MADPTLPTTNSEAVRLAVERTKQASVAGWTAGLTSVVALGGLQINPVWPMAAAVLGVSAMLAVVCLAILRNR